MLGSEFLVGVRVGVRVGGQGQGSGSGWDQFLRSVSGPGSVLRGQCQGWVTFTGQCQGLGQILGVRVKGWVISRVISFSFFSSYEHYSGNMVIKLEGMQFNIGNCYDNA